MSFNGLPPPSQINPAIASPANPYPVPIQTDAPRRIEAVRPSEESPSSRQDDDTEAEDPQSQAGGGKPKKREFGLSEDQRRRLQKMASFRKAATAALEAGTRYRFDIDPKTGDILLVVADTGQVAMQLTPEELYDLSDSLERVAGLLADQAG